MSSNQEKKEKKHARIQRIMKSNKFRHFKITIDRKAMESGTTTTIEDGVTITANSKRMHVDLEIPIFDSSYLDFMLRAMGRYRFSPLLFGSRDPTKEMTEAAAALHHTLRIQPTGKVLVYVIGEGKRPQVSWPLSCLKSDWDIVSIDPQIEPFPGAPEKIDFQKDFDYNVTLNYADYDSVIIIGVHSHNDMTAFWNRIDLPKALILIPCCFDPTLPNPTEIIDSMGILSTKNKIHIWNPSFPTQVRPHIVQ